MHPDILKALIEERHADLLRPYEFRDPAVARRGGLRRVRRMIGAALIGAGTWFLGESTPRVEALDGQP